MAQKWHKFQTRCVIGLSSNHTDLLDIGLGDKEEYVFKTKGEGYVL